MGLHNRNDLKTLHDSNNMHGIKIYLNDDKAYILIQYVHEGSVHNPEAIKIWLSGYDKAIEAYLLNLY